MNFKEYTKPDQLERYSFLWTEVRLLVAAVALFLGGIPPVYRLLPIPVLFGVIRPLLTLSWIISGVAAVYLLYRWNAGRKKLFAHKKPHDLWAFAVAVVSGFNLGLTGLAGTNLGMSIWSGQFIFTVVGLLYVITAVYLWQRWNASGQKLF